MASKTITLKQANMVLTVRNFVHLYGYTPSIRELAQLTGTARGSVVQHLQALRKKGVIRTHARKARAIEILQTA